MKDWKLKFREDFYHTHGLPDGYENWDNYYTALENFITDLLAEVRKEGERGVVAKFIAHMVNADLMADEIRDLMPKEYKEKYLEELI